jgi:hypothetical protein
MPVQRSVTLIVFSFFRHSLNALSDALPSRDRLEIIEMENMSPEQKEG